MKVKMKTLDAGPKGVRPVGAIVEVDEAEGNALIAGGFAVLHGIVAPVVKLVEKAAHEIADKAAPAAEDKAAPEHLPEEKKKKGRK